jgi:asparagine synthase (glutamine-hydrolysing)
MCGIAAIAGPSWERHRLEIMTEVQQHRGPDQRKIWTDPFNFVGLGHNRLSIIDLSERGNQPMTDSNEQSWIAFNGEIYNYLELRRALPDYPYRSETDTEVILAAYERWGEACLDRLIGMFAFVLWDGRKRILFAARDRFGVKPLYYHSRRDGTIVLASEIRTLHAAGVLPQPDQRTWATYLVYGLHDHSERTFWKDISALPAGHKLTWKDGRTTTSCWYDLADRVGPEYDRRHQREVEEEYLTLLQENMRLRFRSDVPVGVNLSGGLDSSIALGLVDRLGGQENTTVFTYITGDPAYDEIPWVQKMLDGSSHTLVVSPLSPAEVPQLAASVQSHQSEPFGGLPTLAYARLFEMAREIGVIVLCDGQGLDEQWAGYDYYANLTGSNTGVVQGSRRSAVRPDCLTPEFQQLAEPLEPAAPFPDALRNRQYLDVRYTKIPRALRFNDRVSARASTELREPFMDHRLFELAFRQPADRKIRNGTRKWLLRQVAASVVPPSISEAPKRPVQTPQREWLLGPLHDWTLSCMTSALEYAGGSWLKRDSVRTAVTDYLRNGSDNSFFLWQWLSVGLMARDLPELRMLSAASPARRPRSSVPRRARAMSARRS